MDTQKEEYWEGSSVIFHFTKNDDHEHVYDFHMANLDKNASNDEIHQFGRALAKLTSQYDYAGATKDEKSGISEKTAITPEQPNA